MIGSDSDEVAKYTGNSFCELHMFGLACIIKDLDEGINSLRNVSGFDQLCHSVDQATHLLLVPGFLPECQQVYVVISIL